ncbi:hypothetical protein IAD21_06149 [Abditibacteriota bacterium]|nr:hypothetical protein IAD21_06149 [Abditibacteriota bacterium]
MKPLDHRFHHFTTLNIVATTLVASVLGLNTVQAIADEPLAATPTTAPVVQPVADDSSGPTQTQDNSSVSSLSTEDLQARLSNLDQRLDKVNAMDLEPIMMLLPNLSSNVPTAYGASQGMVAIGIGYQNRIRYNDDRQDGTAAIVVGLGNPRKLGVDVQGSVLDLSRPTHNGALSFKLHRQLGNDISVAFGGEDAIVSSASDSGSSYYGVISKKIRLAESSKQPFSRLYLSFGVGNKRFLSESDFLNDTGSVNIFGSAAVNLNRSSIAFAEWTGQSLDVGTSLIPFRKHPLAITLALADVAGTAHNGARFTAGVSYVFTR